MAGFNECVEAIIKASGEALSKREAAELLRKFNSATEQLSVAERSAALNDVVAEFRENMVLRNVVFDTVAKNNALMYERDLTASVAKVKNLAADQKISLSSKISGRQFKVKNALDTLLYGSPGKRDGLVVRFNAARTRFNTLLTLGLKERGLEGHWGNPDTVREAVRFLFDTGARDLTPEGQAMGGLFQDIKKLAVGRLNGGGAYVLDTPAVLFNSKVADPAKVAAMGKDAFIEFVNGLPLDKSGFQGTESVDWTKYLEGLYNRLSKEGQFTAIAGQFDGIGGLTKSKYRNLAASNSIDFDIPFADADAFFKFYDALATEPLAAFVGRRVDQIGRSVGLMENFTSVPERFIADLLDKLEPDMTPDDKAFLIKDTFHPAGELTAGKVVKGTYQQPSRIVADFFLNGHPEDLIQHLSGVTQAPVNGTAARLGAGLRAWTSMASLANSAFMQLTDIPLKVAQLVNLGESPFEALIGPIAAFGESFPSAEKVLFYERLGLSAEIMLRNLANTASADGASASSKIMDTYFKLNGSHWLDRIQKQHTADFMSSNLAKALKNPESNVEILNHFRSYGFVEKDFEVFKGAIQDVAGIEVVDPKVLELADAKMYERYLGAMQDIINNVTPTPGFREQATLLKGTRPGTWQGEALRMATQFKSYPSMLLTRVYPAIYYEHGVAGTVGTMVSMLMMWYVADSMKQLSQGKTPLDMSKAENVATAMIRSGFGGVYTDFVGNDYSSQGMSLGSLVAGPVASHLSDLYGGADQTVKTGFAFATGDPDADRMGKKLPLMAAQKLNRALPNVHFGKTILEHTLIYGIMESNNPGSVDAKYEQLKQRTGQERLF